MAHLVLDLEVQPGESIVNIAYDLAHRLEVTWRLTLAYPEMQTPVVFTGSDEDLEAIRNYYCGPGGDQDKYPIRHLTGEDE